MVILFFPLQCFSILREIITKRGSATIRKVVFFNVYLIISILLN